MRDSFKNGGWNLRQQQEAPVAEHEVPAEHEENVGELAATIFNSELRRWALRVAQDYPPEERAQRLAEMRSWIVGANDNTEANEWMKRRFIETLEPLNMIQGAGEYSAAAVTAFAGLAEYIKSNPVGFANAHQHPDARYSGYEAVSDVTNVMRYGIDYGMLHIHYPAPERPQSMAEAIGLISSIRTAFNQEMHTLADVVRAHPEVTRLTATSWLIEQPVVRRLLERAGFIYAGRFPFKIHDKVIGSMYLPRARFLEMYRASDSQ